MGAHHQLCFFCICRLRSCKQRQGLLRVVHVRCSSWNHFYLFEGVLYHFSKQSLFSKLGKFSCGSNLESRFHSILLARKRSRICVVYN